MTSTYRITPLDEVFLNISDQSVMSIQFEIRVEGRFDADKMAAAMRVALGQHEFSRARLARSTIGAVRRDWEIPDSVDHLPLEVTDESPEDVRGRLFGVDVALSTSPPFAATIVRSEGGDYLMLNLHHAVFDGMSVLRFVTSIARAYSGEDDPIGGPPLAEARDLRSVAGSRGISDLLPRATKIARDYVDRRNVTRVAADAPAQDDRRYGFTELRFSEDDTAAVRALKPKGATINDVALAALALTVVKWNREHDEAIGDTVSIMMPVNIRPAEWSSEVVSNFAGYLAVIVPSDLGPDLATAAGIVRDHTTPLKADGVAGWMIDILGPGKYLPSVVKRGLSALLPLVQDSWVESATLSNLGRTSIPSFGGDVGAVTEVWFSPPPLSSILPMAVGMAGIGSELFASFRSDRRHIGDDGARRFAEIYREIMTGAPDPSA
ncbi:condensation domain-containing protein [Antrihabitans cavernicola]|uniref:Condensation domain-containing protein n=1 Tax=Antrihabitans cavernicola TaxID=2495913 RepID=A0A5A7SGN8_9NOCA|nr:condensation domain-containing protein [Spelaeibacter cavernicola]KAA0025006.1 hypothetical protein FOY51_03580 [Spelaeibacter cavernicola]